LRLRVLERFRDKPILQLPQSIHFDDERQLEATTSAIGRHRNFRLAVRDDASFAFARQHFDCEVVLSPDMAFAMPPIARFPAELDYFCLLRSDKEAVASRQAIVDAVAATQQSFIAGDWLDEERSIATDLDRAMGKLTRRMPALAAPLRSPGMWLRQLYAQQRVSYGIGLLSKGATVVTDRLHAHILSCLLGIPHLFLDSYGGKIASFHRTWTHAYATGTAIASPAALADELVRR
jgi:exopolysaccharide biosynthesis predicted pyruvyltransferase EpsI